MSDFLRKVQLTEYEIFKEFDKIAKKHNIKYFIGQGTLLGAVKYKGFIPWDDDIDLLVPYGEIKKLIKVFENEADEKYLITNYKIEKHFPLSWTKIRNKNTRTMPKNYKELKINWGICIDLFHIYPLSDNKLIRKFEIFCQKVSYKLMLAEFTKYEEGHGAFVRLLEKIPIFIRHASQSFSNWLLSLHKKETKYLWINCKGGKMVERKMLFGKDNELYFEDSYYPAPTDTHGYLKLNYGEYEKPLPKELQKGHELTLGDIEWKLEI